MGLPRLLSGAFAVVLLSACTISGQPPVTALSSPTRPSQSPPPTDVPFLRCDTKDLEMQVIGTNGAASNVIAIIEVRNKSSHDCDLYGYAGLQLLDAHGGPLPTQVSWSNESYFGTVPAATIVRLPADTVQISADRPVPGHAYIPIIWGDSSGNCEGVGQFRVTPPGATTSTVVSASSPGGGQGVAIICSGGFVIINPTRAAIPSAS